ncbi:glycosyltransferase [Paenibacillus sp. FSL R7-0331]|uniref:glycosyltransferase n=1 Tax=Paenibacillus sp. FSL R7-0331 TaxID=1536773 RepID=UPI0004F82DEB|nr:glycosyltransferase [Paenibacillus sp. FSL R7-0331]AIQ55096.1 glycosyl transferase family 2 [Paenibacillus sp. FSL R7-0331]
MDFTGERFIPGVTDKELEIEHIQRYEILQDFVKGKRVLDAACGEGYGSYLLSKGAASVEGLDISSESIMNAQLKYNKDNLNYSVGSIDQLPFQNDSFDIVVSFETLEHVNEEMQVNFMHEVTRVLASGGTLIISTPNKQFYSDMPQYNNPFHVKELYKEEFIQLLQTFYKTVNVASQRFEVASVIDSENAAGELYVGSNNVSDSEVYQKYMIAFCSDVAENAAPVASVGVFTGKYNEVISRVLSLQDEVEERNQHIVNLDHEINSLRDTTCSEIKELGARVLAKENQLALVEGKLQEAATEITKRTEEIQKLADNLAAMKVELNNKRGHIDLLLQKDRELQNIQSSTGWKFLRSYYRFRDSIIPLDSKRRVIGKLAVKTLKHPRLMLSKLNKGNLRKFKYYLETEDANRLEGRLDTFVERHNTVEQKDLEVQLYTAEEYGMLTFNEYENPKVSIIIPVYNQWNYTYSCLTSILKNTADVSYEVIIADDMSTDETVNIANYVENITVVRDGVNRGFLLNCNNAAKRARGKYVFFLNNDTSVQPEWLSSLVELADTNENIGMVGSKLVYPDGRLQEAGGIIWNDASGWNYGRLDDPEKPEYNYVKEVDYISGAAILIRSSIWEELGGFDERYVPAYFEDSDLAFEIRQRGYKVLLQPKSVVVHFEGISHGTDTNSGIKSYQVKNKEKFLEKWGAVLSKDHYSNAEHVFWARDRSGKRKTIVVVDHYVPHYDKDAGGRCTFFYLKLFVSLGYHVIFIGDNYFRHEPYTSELQSLGIEVLYGDYYAKNINKWIRANGAYIDYVYLNRPHISVKYISDFKKLTRAKIVYFGHDLHYLREMRNYELTKNPSLIKSSEDWKKIEFGLMNDADVIHVVGSYEQELLQKEFPDKPVRNIPLFPYGDSYSERTAINGFDARKDLLFVGGFNHTPNYDGIIWFLNEVFPLIKERDSDIKLYIVGSNPPEDLKAKATEKIIVTGFVTDEELENYYSVSRLVVVPLRYGAGVKGKVVEALYYQVPIVTTSIGAEGLEQAERVMSIENEADAFAASVIRLYENEEVWLNYSESSQQYINQFFSVEAARKIIAYDFSNQENPK